MATRNDDLSPTVATDEKRVQTPEHETAYKGQDTVIAHELNEFERAHVESDLNVTEEDLTEAKQTAATFSLEDCRKLMTDVLQRHNNDPNFPFTVLEKMREFLGELTLRGLQELQRLYWLAQD